MTDPFRYDSGSYVLGALDPVERHEFEAHLTTCDECAQTVQEFAVLPGLLARVPLAEIYERVPATSPPPPVSAPSLARPLRADGRWALACAAAAVAAVAAGVAAVVRALAEHSASTHLTSPSSRG